MASSQRNHDKNKEERILEWLLLVLPIAIGVGALIWAANGPGWGIASILLNLTVLSIWKIRKDS